MLKRQQSNVNEAEPSRVARLAFLMPKSRNLAFFKVVWHEIIVFGMYVIVGIFLKRLAQLLLSAWN